jgi:tRNA G46 methylase TrmB
MVVVSRPNRLDDAWSGLHARLVRQMGGLLPPSTRSVVELGSGRGQITVPLTQSLPGVMVTAVDQFKGRTQRIARCWSRV